MSTMRGMVDASGNSHNGLEQRGGGRGLFHVVDEQTGPAERVHVTTEWTMDEPQSHTGRDLVDLDVLAEVGTDAPVVLAGGLVLDPAAARRLQQWVATSSTNRPSG